MNKHDWEQPGRRRGSLDGWVSAFLGLALVAVCWLDVRAFRSSRGKVHREFPLLTKPGELRFGNVEIYSGHYTVVQFDNIGQIEALAGCDRLTISPHYRHGLGPETVIEIASERRQARLSFQFFNPVDGQDLTISCNGQVLEKMTDTPSGTLEKSYAFPLLPGINRFTVGYARYNHAGAELAPGDSRSIAGTFLALDLSLQ